MVLAVQSYFGWYSTFHLTAALAEELAACRRRGWSCDLEEFGSGVSCAGAPIRDYRGEGIAAISSAWEGTKETKAIEEIAMQLKETGDAISIRLGCPANLATGKGRP